MRGIYPTSLQPSRDGILPENGPGGKTSPPCDEYIPEKGCVNPHHGITNHHTPCCTSIKYMK